jgi:hypothetical protein
MWTRFHSTNGAWHASHEVREVFIELVGDNATADRSVPTSIQNM